MYQIQPPVPLSSSLLWRLQQASYAAQGMSAWASDKTPSYITSNPHFAESTARVIFAALVDLAPRKETVHIIELGAGSGRFSWLLIEALDRIARQSPLKPAPWRLVMTDVSEAVLKAWTEHPQLKPWILRQKLDFSRFNVEQPRPIRLRIAEAVVQRGPWIVLGNY
ncbi:MAG: hypothetical protein AAFV53_03040, partial [Myxococcota bacterium]